MRVALISLRLSLCDVIALSMVSNLAAIFASLNNRNSIIEKDGELTAVEEDTFLI
jgi:hypothetical protein